MRLDNNKKLDKELTEILAEARGLHFAMRHKAITYEEAKKRVEPMLERLNKAGECIARKYSMRYKKITFQNLGENI
ncbi:MAG TPA: hypothetical protein VGT05_02555 [Patescibacteria group bacterium]|nr:hypothetical protein [Patescibacteria group bacterium]